MANTKISELTALLGADLASADLFVLADTSAVQTKNITKDELIIGLTKGANALADGANIATDLALGSVHTVTLGGNRTLDNPTNKTIGQTHYWIITQDGTGGRTLAFGTDYDFDGFTEINPTAAAITIIQGVVIASDSIRCSMFNGFGGSGTVLQAVSNTADDQYSTAAAAWLEVTTPAAAIITKVANSTILLIASFYVDHDGANAAYYDFRREISGGASTDNISGESQGTGKDGTALTSLVRTMTFLDSPAQVAGTTITYKMNLWSAAGSTKRVGFSAQASTITAFELAP
jgi:hypothetical protein